MIAHAAPEVVVGSLDTLRRRLADDVGREAADCLVRHGRFSVAVPGGSVAVQALPALVGVALDWDRTHVFWVDERAVPASDPESNVRAVTTSWLAPAKVPSTSIHPMPADGADLAAAAETYAAELTRVLGRPPRLDYVVLGVGPDGHVASLFPDHPALAETARPVVAVLDSPKPPPRRLTLTMSMLTGAGRVVVMALSESKATAIGEAIENEASTLPVAEVIQGANRVLVLLDTGAASRLRFE